MGRRLGPHVQVIFEPSVVVISDWRAILALSGCFSSPAALVLFSLPSVAPPLAGTGIRLPVGTTCKWG